MWMGSPIQKIAKLIVHSICFGSEISKVIFSYTLLSGGLKPVQNFTGFILCLFYAVLHIEQVLSQHKFNRY